MKSVDAATNTHMIGIERSKAFMEVPFIEVTRWACSLSEALGIGYSATAGAGLSAQSVGRQRPCR